MLVLGELGRLCPIPHTGLGRTGHHGGDGDGSRYMGGARIKKKENGSLQPSAGRERECSGTQLRLESGLREALSSPDKHAQ